MARPFSAFRMDDSKHVSRRDFVAGSSTLALGALIAPPMIVPRHILGRGYQAPSDTLNIAFVGVGGMGMSNWSQMLSERTAAICDVDYPLVERALASRLRPWAPGTPPANLSATEAEAWRVKRAADAAAALKTGQALEAAYKSAPHYADYREMLDKQKDIDAVVVATPDHMHAMIGLRAMQAGKHVYVQKPLTYSVMEARAMQKAARDIKVVTQMGNQGHSSDDTRRIKEILDANILGPISEVHVWTDRPQRYWAQGIPRPPATPPTMPALGAVPAQWNIRTVDRAVQKAMADVQQTPPVGLNWDLFLGCVPNVPYHPVYHPFSWRGWLDFGVSALGDMGAHLIDQPFFALELGMPVSVAASSTPWGGGNTTPASYPLSTMVEYEFAARGRNKPAVKLMWYDGGLLPPRPKHLPDDAKFGGDGGGVFIGSKGIMVYDTYGSNPTIYPESLRPAAERVDKKLPRVTTTHEMNWIDACKGKTQASSPFEYAAPLTEVMLLGLVALRAGQGRKILYDAENMRVTNIPEANAFLTREYRAGWTL
jgi:predicted dehydrogenase